ncbi:hypothetical protein [Aeromonas sp. R7-4]|uniref:hypothetical protein n=1 Tax=Aeromonas sp. R7-4 TaxID=3138476 RepID=UPI0034A2488F
MKKEKKDIHQKRATFLRRVFGVDEKSPLYDKKLRNAIEHFDERLGKVRISHMAREHLLVTH